MNTAWFVSGVVSLVLGVVLRRLDQSRGDPGTNPGTESDKTLTPLGALSGVLIAYPFCVLYILLDQALRP